MNAEMNPPQITYRVIFCRFLYSLKECRMKESGTEACKTYNFIVATVASSIFQRGWEIHSGMYAYCQSQLCFHRHT